MERMEIQERNIQDKGREIGCNSRGECNLEGNERKG